MIMMTSEVCGVGRRLEGKVGSGADRWRWEWLRLMESWGVWGVSEEWWGVGRGGKLLGEWGV